MLDIRVTKIMKSNGGHVMLLKNGWYMRGQISRLDQFTKFIHIDVFKIVLAMAHASLFRRMTS